MQAKPGVEVSWLPRAMGSLTVDAQLQITAQTTINGFWVPYHLGEATILFPTFVQLIESDLVSMFRQTGEETK